MLLSAWAATICRSQVFNSTPVSFTPPNLITFKMNLPITHLDINNYTSSTRGIYVGRPATFKFYNRNAPWTAPNLFMRIRWDNDLDASNGVAWSDWFQDQNENAYATVTKTFWTAGRYTITFEIEFYTSDGAQAYSRQKQYDITVVPVPTAVYQDSHNNQLFYWVGSDGVFDKPALAAEGYDPDNSNTPAINYGLGFDVIELARSQGYDVFIIEWADGGASVTVNRDVFLGACQFVHRLLGSREAAVQVIAISMGGVVARDALAWAEDGTPGRHAGQYIEHYVNTMISFDAPQQGAHVNTEIQRIIKDQGNPQQQVALRAQAAQQLLYDDLYDATRTVHSSFFSELRGLHNDEQPFGYTNGYPRRCKNYTVSNGNRSRDYPAITTNDNLATIYEYANVNVLSIATFPAIQHTEEIKAQDRDLWPGSTFPHDMRTLSTQGFKDFLSVGPGGLFLMAGGGWIFRVNFNPSYTPTESALDLDGYTRTPDGSLLGGTSWFDDTLTQTRFRRHEELTVESKNKVINWLNQNLTYPYLGRPSAIRAAAAGSLSIQINYQDESAYESGFKIERKIDGGSFTEIATLGANQTQYLDNDPALQPFKTYTYRIRSYNGSRYSAYSDEAPVALQPHLSSSSPSATASNAQHKLVQTTSPSTGATDFYMAYESSGGSYLSHSTAAGSTWDREQTIGGIPTAALSIRHPSLVLDSLGASTYVAYEKVDALSATHTILLDGYDRTTGTLYPLLTLGSFSGDTSYHATPVAAISKAQGWAPSYLVASWKNGSTLAFGIGTYLSSINGSGFRWSTSDLSGIFLTSFQNAVNPAAAVTMLGPTTKPAPNFYLAWEEGGTTGGIRLLHGWYASSVWPPRVSDISWEGGQIIHVADNSAAETNSRPSIALDASGKLYVAWQYRNATGTGVAVQGRSAYNSVVAVPSVLFSPCGGSAASSPSLSDYRYTDANRDDMLMSWSASNSLICAKFTNGAWSGPYVVAPGGSQPNLQLTFNSSDLNRMVVYTGSTAPPFTINTMTIPEPQPPSKTMLSSPSNNSMGNGTSLSLYWNCTIGASSYNLHVNDDLSYSRDISTSQNAFSISGLNYSTSYHWRVQAVNTTGSGIWSDSWTFKTQGAPGSGGCPFVFGWNGEEFVADNNILPQSEAGKYKNNGVISRDVTDFYELLLPPRLENGRYMLSIREFERECSHLDQIQLIAVDHSPSTGVAVLPDGEISQYIQPFTLVEDACRCNDFAVRLSGMEGSAIRTTPHDTIALKFQSGLPEYANLNDSMEGGLLLGGWVVRGKDDIFSGKLQSVGSVTVTLNSVGGSSQYKLPGQAAPVRASSGATPTEYPGRSEGSSAFTFREHPTLVYVPLVKVSRTVNVNFGARVAFDYASLAVKIPAAYRATELTLLTATHSRNGSVALNIRQQDGFHTELHPGESIELQYEAPPLSPGEVRSFVLVSHGRYERLENAGQTPQGFHLGQNFPNPFNPRTTLEYQLATPGRVLLVVYDLMGQEIRRLVDEYQEAGLYEKTWDAGDSPSGVYHIRMSVVDQSGKQLYQGVRKIVLMR